MEGFVHDQKESAQVSTPSIVGAAGHVIDASSDYFTNVMGFLDVFVKIGGEITKVSVLPSWTTFCSSYILVGSSVCETGLGCDHSGAEGVSGVSQVSGG